MSEVWDAGTVFVYAAVSFGEMSLSARLEGRVAIAEWVEGTVGGGRFGTSLTVIGDLDRDGFSGERESCSSNTWVVGDIFPFSPYHHFAVNNEFRTLRLTTYQCKAAVTHFLPSPPPPPQI